MPLDARDLIELQMLYARYEQLFDSGDLEGWLALFAEDITYRVVPHSDSGEWSTPHDVHGLDELRRFIEGRWSTVGGLVRHFAGNVVIDDSGDPIRGTGAGFTVDLRGDTPKMRITGTFEDEFVKNGSRWQFKKRVIRPDH